MTPAPGPGRTDAQRQEVTRAFHGALFIAVVLSTRGVRYGWW
jgi:hypothetical protein